MPKDTLEVKIDNLANAVGQGFKEVHERLDRVDNRLEHVEGRLGAVEEQVKLLRADVQEIRYDHKKMLTRIENLELKAFGSLQE